MDYLIAIYTGKKLFTLTLKPGITATVGDSLTDTIVMERSGLGSSYLTLTCEQGGVKIHSRKNMKYEGQETSNRVFSSGDVVAITEIVTLAIFDSHNKLSGSLNLREFDELQLGRSFNSNDICLRYPNVSSVHAALERIDSHWHVKDLNSRNGTFVNGQLVEPGQSVIAEEVNVFIGGFMFYIQNDTLQFSNTPGEVEFQPDLMSEFIQNTKPVQKRYPFFQKSPRLRPRTEKLEFEIMSPPNAGNKPQISWLSLLLPPFLMVVVMSSVAIMMKNYTMLMFSVPMSLMSVVVTIVNNKSNLKKWQKTNGLALEKYQEHLIKREQEITKAEGEYISSLSLISPGVHECIAIAENVNRRLWERTNKDSDFLSVRLGTGEIESNVKIRIPRAQLQIEENVSIKQAEELQERHVKLTGVPVCHSFLSSPITGLAGRPEHVRQIAGRIILDIATHHSYEDVKIVCVYPEEESKEWEWIKWLPHVWNAARTKRYIACTREDSRTMLREIGETLKIRRRDNSGNSREDVAPAMPFYFLLLADRYLVESSGEQFLPESSSLGFATLYAYGDIGALPGECQTVITCDNPACVQNTTPEAKNRNVFFMPDKITVSQLDKFARALAPVRLLQSGKGDSWPKSISFLQGFHVRTVEELKVLERWQKSWSPKSLAAPIGVKANGDTFSFDIYEKAMGPHGITAGTSGSGKSEMLTTWLLSMALNFSPDDLNLALIEFKGNDLSNILKPLPHIAGVVSNMNDPSTIARCIKSLEGEKARRMKIFEEATWLSTKSISAYQTYQKEHVGVEPLPYLLIVVDEFAEFATQYPEYSNDFINSIARVGRSIGMYIVLTMQSPQGVVKGQVSSNTKFRICLKTANASESKEILGTNDAFGISAPGRAIIKVGNNEVYEQVQTFYAKAPYNPASTKKGPTTEINIVELNGKRTRPVNYDKTVKATRDALSEGNAIVNNIIETAKNNTISWARHVWLDPLPPHPIDPTKSNSPLQWLYLNDLVQDRLAFQDGQWTAKNSGMSAIVGMIDDPAQQAQYPFVLDFANDGHQVVYGAPSSGKTTFIQTTLLSVALTYTPEQVHFLIFDYGNAGLKIFDNLPHTLLITGPGDKENITKAKDFIEGEINSRKALFASNDVGDLEAYREVSGKTLPIVIITVDNVTSLYNNNPELMDLLSQLAREGGSLGLYLLLSNTSTSNMFKVTSYVKSSHTLQMTDKSDYKAILSGKTKTEPGSYSGRGLTTEFMLEFQTALCVNGETPGERVKILRELCKSMSDNWTGKKASIDSAEAEPVEIGDLESNSDYVQIGMNKQTRQPVEFSFNKMGGCIITGTDGGGKSNVLGLIARTLAKDEKTKLYIYEDKPFLENLCKGAKVVHDGKGTDEIMIELEQAFNERDDESEGRIVLCVDNFLKFYEDMSEDSAKILNAITEGGADRGIYTYITFDSKGLAKTYTYRVKSFANCLVNENAIVVGGNLASYLPLQSLHSGENLTFAKYEGCIIHNKKLVQVKFAKV